MDTETYESPHPSDNRTRQLRFRLGVARFGRWDGSTFNAIRTLKFTRITEFWEVLGEHSRSKCVQWVFAHNLLFDAWILGLPEMLDNGEFQLSVRKSDQRIRRTVSDSKSEIFVGQCSLDKGATIIKGVLAKRRVNLIDTYNYFRCSVSSLGDSIGIPKLPMPNVDSSDEDWFRYCERDVQVIQEAVCGLMREWKANDLGNWQPTLPSLAYSAYRHRFMVRPIVCHGDADVSKIEHDAYFDGRTSVYFSGNIGNGYSLFPQDDSRNNLQIRARIEGTCYSVDVNSLYPSVMLNNDYPYEAVTNGSGRPVIFRPPSLDWLREQLETYLCVAICQIDTSDDLYPVRTGNGTIYPIGKIWTTLCTPEIILALDRQQLHSVMGCVLYRKFPIFDQWVEYWWERKRAAEQAGNLVRREVCKILLNSLAGKLAQRDRYWINTSRWPCESRWNAWCGFCPGTREPIPLRSIGMQVQYLANSGFAPHALVACAAHVNSYARVRMIHDRIGMPKRSVLYCANDGLLLTESGVNELRIRGILDTGELGQYRTVGCYEQASIYGPRDYCCDGDTRKAGLPKDREQISNRRWKVKRFESANAMICRPPDGSIHLHEDTVSGSEHHWGQWDDGTGWLRPNLVDMWSK